MAIVAEDAWKERVRDGVKVVLMVERRELVRVVALNIFKGWRAQVRGSRICPTNARFRSYHQRNSPHLSNEEFQPLICRPHPFLQLLKLRQVHLHCKFQVDSLSIQVLEVLQRSRRIGEEI